MRIVGAIASDPNWHVVSGYYLQRTLGSVIPGLTRNPVFFWIPAPGFRGDKFRGNDVVGIACFLHHLGKGMRNRAYCEV